MIDTYLASSSLEELQSFCSFFSQVIGIEKGRPAVDANPSEGVEASPAAGDPTKYYTCIRAPITIPASGNITIVPPDEGIAVVGVWA